MKKLMILLTILLSVNAHANVLGEQEQNYIMFCGSIEDLTKLAAQQGEILSKEDILELSESRKGILSVLKTGTKGIQKLLDEGSQTDTGPLGAIMTCGTIDLLKNEIVNVGCFDLKTNKAVKDKGGIKACSDFMSKIPR